MKQFKPELWQAPIFIFVFLSVISFQNCSPGFAPADRPEESRLGSDESPSPISPAGTLPNSSPPAETPAVPIVDVAAEIDQKSPACATAAYAGWKCLSTKLKSQEGLLYSIEFRWNRVATSSLGTVIWVNGNHGNAPFRSEALEAKRIQDRLSSEANVRSIEIIFADPVSPSNPNSGGYWKYPRGYYSAASAYLAALEFVANQGLKRGAFLNHVGASNGTMVAAYALANFNAGQYLDRLILSAGPFLSDLETACTPGHPASFQNSPTQLAYIKMLMNYWSSGDANRDICGSSPDRSSILKFGSKHFPKTAIHVFMGAREEPDGFGPWILNSNAEWFNSIQAPEKSRSVIETMGHEYYWPGIYDLARRPAPFVVGPN